MTNDQRRLAAHRLPSPFRLAAWLALAFSVTLFASGCQSPPDPAKVALEAAFDADHGRVGEDLIDKYEMGKLDAAAFEADWRVEEGDWRVKEGKLVGSFFTDDLPTSGTARVGAPRALAWLKRPLPREFVATWKARGVRGANDLNAYFCAKGKGASGYEVVFGGRGNEQSWLCLWAVPDDFASRAILDKVKPDALRQGKVYEFRVERTRRGIKVYRDGRMVMDRSEREPPLGEEDRSFGFSTWDNEAEFSDLKIVWRDSAATEEG
jgi:hypothetical protein